MQTFLAARAGGTKDELGDSMENPKNINVRTSIARSERSFENTCNNKDSVMFMKCFIQRVRSV